MKSLDKIIRGCKKNKAWAQAELFAMYSDKMFGICLYYTNNKQDAEDVLHDGFLKVFEHIAELKHDNLEAWMRRIFINTALMLYRRSKFQSDMENVEDSSSDYGIEDSGFDVHELMQLIQLLPQQYRLVFNLYAIEGYKPSRNS